jgi:WD40 repeat protein
MYRIAEIIEHDGPLSMVVEVSFHPSGSCFAATYENTDEVRIYDSATRKLVQVLRNPDAQLDHPHSLVFTEKYLLVGNVHDLQRPGTINVYPVGETITKPIHVFQSPFDHLREPHSLAIRDGILVATYCENRAPTGAIVTYGFDGETGTITGPLDKTESWFSEYGDSKGLCFSADGTKIFVTFESDRHFSAVGKIFSTIRRAFRSLASDLSVSAKLKKLSSKAKSAFGAKRPAGKKPAQPKKPSTSIGGQATKPTKNGIAMFAISADGKIARSPERLLLRRKFCRLENINIFDQTCVVTDVSSRSLSLYDLSRDPSLRAPLQTVKLGKAAPHGAKFSPDGKLLVVSCIGLKIIDREPKFFDWESPRQDKIFVFERAS